MAKLRVFEQILLISFTFQVIIFKSAKCSVVDYSYCRKYNASGPINRLGAEDKRSYPFVYMGSTWEKHFFMSTQEYTGSFNRAALSICPMFGMRLARIKTACDYGIVEKWFFNDYPTDYYAWIGGMRFGFDMQAKWIGRGMEPEPVDLSPFGWDVNFLPGPYPPGGYDPIPYPWVNCMCVSRNCPLFIATPTEPCEQTPTYPPQIKFSFADCRITTFRIICEESIY